MEANEKKYIRKLRRVYVWETPVRFFHWLNVLAILVLIVTGFFISNPLAMLSNKEASQQYIMGWFRFLHFAAAYIFFFNYLFRLYWAFAGNKYASWRQFIPTSTKFFKDFWHVLKVDILMLKKNGKQQEHVSIGHNAMAGFTYFLAFLFFIIQCLTGFGLYASMGTWWFPKLFAWVPAMFGGDILTRQIHHIVMWFFILFTVIHVYLVMFHDYAEGRGEVSSMTSGWKFIEEKEFEKSNPTSDNTENK